MKTSSHFCGSGNPARNSTQTSRHEPHGTAAKPQPANARTHPLF